MEPYIVIVREGRKVHMSGTRYIGGEKIELKNSADIAMAKSNPQLFILPGDSLDSPAPLHSGVVKMADDVQDSPMVVKSDKKKRK